MRWCNTSGGGGIALKGDEVPKEREKDIWKGCVCGGVAGDGGVVRDDTTEKIGRWRRGLLRRMVGDWLEAATPEWSSSSERLLSSEKMMMGSWRSGETDLNMDLKI
ncbi:unnamed protein product [Ilex paraguariensis]|uniref:Uncharacterized protein n=1 Tax=Ilex paraguariensis TaxID=185542 RepID=A0ABC8UPZ4_9AQUA